LYLSDAVINLRGILQKARVSGFPQEYSETLLHLIFNDDSQEPYFSPAYECAWPPAPVETASLQWKEAITRATNASYFRPLHYTRSTSFAEDIKNEMLKYTSSIDSNKSTQDDASVHKQRPTPTSGTTDISSDVAQKYHDRIDPNPNFNNLTSSQVQFPESDANNGLYLIGAAAASNFNSQWGTPNSEDDYRAHIDDNDSERHLLVVTPTTDSRASTPQILHEMNKRNEQDPAFVRTVDALRSIDKEDKPKATKKGRAVSMIPSPVRKKEEGADRAWASLGSKPQSKGTVRRYLNFVTRLRGG